LLVLNSLKHEKTPSKEGDIALGNSNRSSDCNASPLDPSKSERVFTTFSDEYAQLQRRIFLATISISALVVGISAIFLDLQTTSSLIVGSFFGLLYFRLLARSIGKLGTGSQQVGKIQLIVPVLLVLATTKLPQLDLIPSLLGFLLYKPSLIFQTILESRA
tara:strand:- start:209 stop:691 length:483 start_codon:yes stop_codon:yes gene_type:complete